MSYLKGAFLPLFIKNGLTFCFLAVIINNSSLLKLIKEIYMQEFSFKDAIKALVPKTKLILVILIIAAIVGGCIGAAAAYAKSYFGTSIEFYINPKRDQDAGASSSQFGVYGAYGQHVMDNIVKLLQSESFAEEMLLDEDGLPIESVLEKESDRTEIDQKIAEATEPISKTKEAKAAEEAAAAIMEDKKLAYANATSLASKMNSNYLSLVSSNASAEEIAEAKRLSEEAAAKEQQAKHEYDAAEQDHKMKLSDYNEAYKKSLGNVNAVLDIWRKSEVYKEYIEILTTSVKYSYIKEDEVQIGNTTEALAKSFIYVNIRVSQNSEIAEFVYDRVNEVLPRYVQENMAVPSGYVATNCQRITRLDNIEQTSSGKILISAVKYAVIFGLLAAFVSAFLIVVSKNTKEWLVSFKKELAEEKKAESSEEQQI